MYSKLWEIVETLLLKVAVEDPTTHSVFGPSIQSVPCNPDDCCWVTQCAEGGC